MSIRRGSHVCHDPQFFKIIHVALQFTQFKGLTSHSQHAESSIEYRKTPKNSDVRKLCCNHPNIWTVRLYHWEMLLKDADGIANSVDPDQTAPRGHAQAYMSKNLGSLRYLQVAIKHFRTLQGNDTANSFSVYGQEVDIVASKQISSLKTQSLPGSTLNTGSNKVK